MEDFSKEHAAKLNSKYRYTSFGDSVNDNVALHVYSGNTLLRSNLDIKSWSAADNEVSKPAILLDVHNDVRDLGFVSGEYTLQYFFSRNVIGNGIDQFMSISEISGDRTEIALSGKDNEQINDTIVAFSRLTKQFFIEFPNLQLKFGQVDFARIVNWKKYDNDTVIVKLYEPLPQEYNVESECTMVLEMIESLEQPIHIIDIEEDKSSSATLLPNFDIDINKKNPGDGVFETWDSILGDNKDTRQQLLDMFVSKSSDSALLNIDYSNYANFVHFGSAVERLENFKYKVGMLEQYNATIATIGTVAQASASKYITSNKTEYELKIADIKNGFDGYEKYLYSENETNSWPKSSTAKPWKLHTVASSQATTWFASSSLVAQHYDTVVNEHNLEHTIPFHIKEDNDNENYLLFVNMIGQHFDEVWSYIEYTKQIHSRENKLYEGVSKDLVYSVLSSFGWDSYQGHHFTDLWEYSLGLNKDGSYGQTLQSGSFSTSGKTVGASSTTINNGKLKLLIKDTPGFPGAPYTWTGTFTLNVSGTPVVTTMVPFTGDLLDLANIGSGAYSLTATSATGVVALHTGTIAIGGATVLIAEVSFGNNIAVETILASPQQKNGSISRDELSKETWKRMLNNLPYLLKTKGTERGIKALLTTYGLPPSLLRVFEYGGPNKEKKTDSYVIYDKFNYSLEFGNDTKWIDVPWEKVTTAHPYVTTNRKPDVIECRFNTWTPVQSGVGTQFIWSVNSHIGVYLEAHSNVNTVSSKYYNHGKVVFASKKTGGYDEASSSWLPIYDNDWWNVAVTVETHSMAPSGANSFKLSVMKAADHSKGRITHVSTASVAVANIAQNWHNNSNNTLHIGGDTVTNLAGAEKSFSGSMQEFRYYILPDQTATDAFLQGDILKNHVRSPLSTEGYHATGSYDQLVARWSMGADLNRFSGSWTSGNMGTAIMSSSHPSYHNQYSWFQTTAPTGIPSTGFAGDVTIDWPTEEEKYYTAMPNLVGTREMGDKVRIESSELTGRLDPVQKKERSQFDKAPLDSNRLGVYFAPHFNIDLDIAHDLGGIRFDNFVGNPLDYRNKEYKALRPLRQHYWKKHNNPYDFFDYLKILRHLDHTLFSQVEHLIPARCNAQVGLLIKGNMLERPKIEALQAIQEEMHFEGKLNLLPKELLAITTTLGGVYHKKFKPFTSQSWLERRPGGWWQNEGPQAGDIALQAHTGFQEESGSAYGVKKTDKSSGALEVVIVLGDHHGYNSKDRGARYRWREASQFIRNGVTLTNPTASMVQGGASYENGGSYITNQIYAGAQTSYDVEFLQTSGSLIGTTVLNANVAYSTNDKHPVHFTHKNSGSVEYETPFNDRGNIKNYHHNRISRRYNAYEFLHMSLTNNMGNKAATYYSNPGKPMNGYTAAELTNGYYHSATRPVMRREVRAQVSDYRCTAKNNLYFAGCKLVGSDFNMPVLETVDGGPVVEFTETNPNKLVIGSRNSSAGDLRATGRTMQS